MYDVGSLDVEPRFLDEIVLFRVSEFAQCRVDAAIGLRQEYRRTLV